MVEIITNPTREQLVAAFAKATEAANASGRTRLVDERNEYRADRVMSLGHGCHQADGGGVANSYGHRAESSVLAYAWYTRTDGVKVVRSAADRVGVSGRHVTSLNLGTRAQQDKLTDACPAALVESSLFAVYSQNRTGVPAGFLRRVNKTPAESTNWLALADWLDEQNGPAPVVAHPGQPSDADLAALIRGAVSSVECGC